MKLNLKKTLAVLVVALLVLTGCGSKDKGGKGDKFKVYLVTMDQMDQHWVSVDKGAQEAAKELGNVEYKWLAPDVKDDAKQIENINNAVSAGADVILLAANGPDAVTSALKDAEAAGVKIIYVDSAANHPGLQTLATDNEAAGETAGKEMLKALEAKGVKTGDIGIISTNSATDSTNKRIAGFTKAFEGSDYKILETQYGDGDVAKSKDIASNFIANGAVALFGGNEGSTVGAGNAVLESNGAALAIGFDTSDTIISLIKNGNLIATMVQDPYKMGYEGVKAAAQVMEGKELSAPYIDTGVKVITKENAE